MPQMKEDSGAVVHKGKVEFGTELFGAAAVVVGYSDTEPVKEHFTWDHVADIPDLLSDRGHGVGFVTSPDRHFKNITGRGKASGLLLTVDLQREKLLGSVLFQLVLDFFVKFCGILFHQFAIDGEPAFHLCFVGDA